MTFRTRLFAFLLAAGLLGAGPAQALERNVSGMWFNAQRDGEGIVVDLIDDTTATVYWFTYDRQGNAMWLFGVGEISGNRIQVAEVFRPSGARFGIGFDPADVDAESWGSLELRFPGCKTGSVDYDGPAGFGSGTIALERLTAIAGASCQAGGAVPGFLGGISGGWYDPRHDGEGFLVQVLEDGRVLFVWFTYEPDGDQAWVTGLGEMTDNGFVVSPHTDAITARGARFGNAFDPADVERSPWGAVIFQFNSCSDATLSYEGPPDFGGGRQNLVRLFTTRDVNCNDGNRVSSSPANINLSMQPGRADSGMLVPDEPLTLNATAANGVAMQLDVPAGAVVAPRTISLTPATIGAGGSRPFDRESAVVAVLEPHGLELLETATLTLSNLPNPVNNAGVAFGFRDLGDDVYRDFARPAGGAVEIRLDHFSGAGAGVPDDPGGGGGGPINSEGRARNALADLVGNGGEIDMDDAAAVLQEWYETEVTSRTVVALNHEASFNLAAETFKRWRSVVEMVYLVTGYPQSWLDQFSDEIERALDRLALALDRGVDNALMRCVDENDAFESWRMMRWYHTAERLELFGRSGLTRAGVRQAVRDCARFRLVVDVVVDGGGAGGNIRAEAQARVPLELNEALTRFEGEGIFEYQRLFADIPQLCVTEIEGDDGTFIVFDAELFDPNLGYAGQPAPSMSYNFTRMEEAWERDCPSPAPGQHPFETYVHLTAGYVSGQVVSPEVEAIESGPDSRFVIDGFSHTLGRGDSMFGFSETVVDETGQLTVEAEYRLEHDPRSR